MSSQQPISSVFNDAYAAEQFEAKEPDRRPQTALILLDRLAQIE